MARIVSACFALAIAGPLVSSELHLTGSQFGLLSTAFFVTYALFQLVSGALADRMDVKWLLAAGFALWSIATGVAGLVHGYAALFVARLILGAGESVAYPSYSRILSHHFTEEQRGWPNAVISAGFSFGLASGLFFGGMLVGRIGWRPFFVGLCAIRNQIARRLWKLTGSSNAERRSVNQGRVGIFTGSQDAACQ